MKDKTEALMERRLRIEIELRNLKAKEREAKARAWSEGVYMEPSEFRKLQDEINSRVATLHNLAIQMRKARTASSSEHSAEFSDCLIQAAKKYLTGEEWGEIVELAKELQAKRSEAA